MTAVATNQLPKANAEILLESGTNELEVLVFGMGGGEFGVNVAKVREVILPTVVTASPTQHSAVRGMFNLRGRVLPLVDLHRYLNIEPAEDESNRRIIVTEFNGQHTAFMVDRVEQIHRMSWQNMRPVPDTHGDSHFCLTGITEIGDRLVLMLDFESVVDHINMEDQLHIDVVENKLGVDRGTRTVCLAEDSQFIRGLMHSTLSASGYGQIKLFGNGEEIWRALEQADAAGEKLCDVLITDVEMPRIDGLHLCRKMKADNRFNEIPVILFSSLITEDTRHKGEQVGADEQIAKPQLPYLVEIVDRWVHELDQREGKVGAGDQAAGGHEVGGQGFDGDGAGGEAAATDSEQVDDSADAAEA
jgi:two-component system chemotaxis response regulator CheV